MRSISVHIVYLMIIVQCPHTAVPSRNACQVRSVTMARNKWVITVITNLSVSLDAVITLPGNAHISLNASNSAILMLTAVLDAVLSDTARPRRSAWPRRLIMTTVTITVNANQIYVAIIDVRLKSQCSIHKQ
jgi:hypothetical protein